MVRFGTKSKVVAPVRTQEIPVVMRGDAVIGIDRVNATSLGTGTDKTLLGGANLVLPDWAKSIVDVRPIVNIDVPTVSESVLAKLILESDDFNIGPYEVLASPISSCLGATIAPFVASPEVYPVNCPVEGGQLKIYGQALVANTAAPVMSCSVKISSEPPRGPQYFAKMGTLTASGTTASTEVAGTQYQFSKGKRITEMFGALVPDTIAAGDALSGYIRYSSSEFSHVTPSKLELNPCVGGLSTIFSTKIDGVSRQKVSIPLNAGQTNIQDYLYMDLAPAAAGNFVSGVMFV